VELRVERGEERFTLEIVGSNLTADPAVQGLALNLRDISERKGLEETAARAGVSRSADQARQPEPLPRSRPARAGARAPRPADHVAVMFLDSRRLQERQRHARPRRGDRLLQAVAERLVSTMRTTDTVARLAGDEFAVLLEGVDGLRTSSGPPRKLVEALGMPFVDRRERHRGRHQRGRGALDARERAEDLLSNADIAMYNAKAAGQGSL
jgi:diguanylate cyclase (GGDEF)-like protein